MPMCDRETSVNKDTSMIFCCPVVLLVVPTSVEAFPSDLTNIVDLSLCKSCRNVQGRWLTQCLRLPGRWCSQKNLVDLSNLKSLSPRIFWSWSHAFDPGRCYSTWSHPLDIRCPRPNFTLGKSKAQNESGWVVFIFSNSLWTYYYNILFG